ncbi:hypothetical protein [Speluncibacter jeojiensis]|uniref:Uncharacterized protein n=1 Tax=Speluncibacter jeojiensis TaxID=2710754 RepID=A0A9X4REY9_9ACTN|nr:hypothetical protein [Rhodococcus sp. D2-41]MDG3016370.1 hypothetical protein [Corynebacteriales bacterium D3-21]
MTGSTFIDGILGAIATLFNAGSSAGSSLISSPSAAISNPSD